VAQHTGGSDKISVIIFFKARLSGLFFWYVF